MCVCTGVCDTHAHTSKSVQCNKGNVARLVEGLLSMHDIPDVSSSAPLKPGMYSEHVKIQRQEDSDFMAIFSCILNLRLSLDTVLDPVSVLLLHPSPKKGAEFAPGTKV